MVREKRFLPVESHEPVQDDADEIDLEMGDDEAYLPKKKSLYVAS